MLVSGACRVAVCCRRVAGKSDPGRTRTCNLWFQPREDLRVLPAFSLAIPHVCPEVRARRGGGCDKTRRATIARPIANTAGSMAVRIAFRQRLGWWSPGGANYIRAAVGLPTRALRLLRVDSAWRRKRMCNLTTAGLFMRPPAGRRVETQRPGIASGELRGSITPRRLAQFFAAVSSQSRQVALAQQCPKMVPHLRRRAPRQPRVATTSATTPRSAHARRR